MLIISTMLDKLQSAMKNLGSACLVAMALITCVDVACRGFFNSPIFGTGELVSIMAVLALAFALPSAHVERSHISVELFTRMLPRRARIMTRLIVDLVALALFSLVTWRMWIYGQTMQESGEVSMNLELPLHFVIYILSFGFFVFALMILKDILSFVYRKEE